MSFHYGAKTISIDGAPCRVANFKFDWQGAELIEATRARGFKEVYYRGAHRVVIDGVPMRVAAHVKDWKAKNRQALCEPRDELGLIADAPRKWKGRYYHGHEGFYWLARFHGDLFHTGPDWQAQVVAEYLCDVVLRWRGWIDIGGGKTIERHAVWFESDAADAIGWALYVFGHYHLDHAWRG